MLRLACAVLVVALAFAPVFAADPEPQEFASKEGKFKATFPSKVESKETKGKEGTFTTYTFVAQPKQGAVYNVTYFDLGVNIPANMAKDVLAQITSKIGGKTLSDKEVEFGKNKLPAREGVYELTNAHVRQIIILDGQRVYQVIVGGPKKEDVTTKEADKFLESFQITK